MALACYGAGASIGTLVTRRATPDWWRYFVRGQLLAVGSTVAVLAGWRLTVGSSLWGGFALAAAMVAVYAVAETTRRRIEPVRSAGEAALESWAASANTSFWGIPMTTVIAGPAGAVAMVLADQLLTPLDVLRIRLLRRDAPHPQHARTSVFDYAGASGFVIGIILGRVVVAPAWTASAISVLGPFLAFSGALMWSGSVQHVLRKLERPTRDGWERYLLLSAVRIVAFGVVAVCFWRDPVAVAALLCALTAPTFFPPTGALLYGYHSHTVGIASRWGWLLPPLGFSAAWLAR